MINNFCVCTLTHSTTDRDKALKDTISSFLEEYNGNRFEWFIWVNVSNPEINEVLDWAVETYSNKAKFNIHISDVNLGPGGGINRLNELSKEYEYSFFIEGDWIHVPGKIAGISRNWIQNSIKLLEDNPDLDFIHLRRYLDDADHRMYSMGWINEKNLERIASTGDRFYILKNKVYVNTPTLRRMSSFYKKEVFPLYEQLDENGNPTEIKGNPNWGMAEINAWKKDLKAGWIEFGNFVHWECWPYKQDWNSFVNDEKGCNKFNLRGKTRCKYGFLVPSPIFCMTCKSNTTVTDINEHSKVYEQTIREIDLYEKENERMTDEQYVNYFESIAVDPTVRIRELIDLNNYETIRKNWRQPNT